MEVKQARYNQRKFSQKMPKSHKFRYWVTVALFVATIAYGSYAVSRPLPTVSAELLPISLGVKQELAIHWPTEGQAAVGDVSTGLIAMSSTNDSQKPIASITKLITALAVVNKNPLGIGEQGQTYRITQSDVGLYSSYVAKSGSVLPVSVGQEITQYQALQAMLLPSANNIADSLAIWTFGSIDQYVSYANELTKSYNMTNTVVTDASGFSPSTVSTLGDLIILAQKSLENPVIADIVAQKQALIPGSGLIKNTNQLLNDPNTIGLKTGTTDQAGSCLLFAVKHGPDLSHTLVGAVVGQSNWTSAYKNIRSLRDSALSNYGDRSILPAMSEVARFNTDWGETTSIVNDTELVFYSLLSNDINVEVDTTDGAIPIDAGSSVGRIIISENDVVVSESNLQTQRPVANPGIQWRLSNPFFY